MTPFDRRRSRNFIVSKTIVATKEITVRRATLILGVCLVLILFSSGCGRGTETGVKIDGELGISAAVSLTEAHIKSLMNSLEVMVMTDEIKSGNWEKMRPILTKFGQSQIPSVVWFALPDGSYSTVDLGKTDKNISDRAYFPKVIAGEKILGDLLVSKTTSEKVVVAAVPVKNGGKVIGALGASAHLEKLSEIIVNELQLSGDMVFYAVNDQGKIALHTEPELILRDVAELGSESFSKAVRDMVSSKKAWYHTRLVKLRSESFLRHHLLQVGFLLLASKLSRAVYARKLWQIPQFLILARLGTEDTVNNRQNRNIQNISR